MRLTSLHSTLPWAGIGLESTTDRTPMLASGLEMTWESQSFKIWLVRTRKTSKGSRLGDLAEQRFISRLRVRSFKVAARVVAHRRQMKFRLRASTGNQESIVRRHQTSKEDHL